MLINPIAQNIFCLSHILRLLTDVAEEKTDLYNVVIFVGHFTAD